MGLLGAVWGLLVVAIGLGTSGLVYILPTRVHGCLRAALGTTPPREARKGGGVRRDVLEKQVEQLEAHVVNLSRDEAGNEDRRQLEKGCREFLREPSERSFPVDFSKLFEGRLGLLGAV